MGTILTKIIKLHTYQYTELLLIASGFLWVNNYDKLSIENSWPSGAILNSKYNSNYPTHGVVQLPHHDLEYPCKQLFIVKLYTGQMLNIKKIIKFFYIRNLSNYLSNYSGMHHYRTFQKFKRIKIEFFLVLQELYIKSKRAILHGYITIKLFKNSRITK